VQTNAIVLRVRADDAEEFERGFREHEYPIWQDFSERGVLLSASLTRGEYGSHQTAGIVNYILTAVFEDMSGHTAHDNDPRFEAWNQMADRYQVEEPLVFGGTTLLEI
jgi:hypothetical protein